MRASLVSYVRYAATAAVVLAVSLLALYLYVFLTGHKQRGDLDSLKKAQNETLVLGGPVLQGPLNNGSLVPVYPGGVDPGWVGSNGTCSLGLYLSADGRVPQYRCDAPVPAVLPPSGVVPGFYGPYQLCLPANQQVAVEGIITSQICVPVSSLVNIVLNGSVTGTNDNTSLAPTGVVPGLYGNESCIPFTGFTLEGRAYVAGCIPTSRLVGIVLNGTSITGTNDNPILAPTGVVPGCYGNETHNVQLCIDAEGRIDNATAIPLPTSTLTNATFACGDLTGVYPCPRLRNQTDLLPGTYFNLESITILANGLTVNVTTYTDAALRQSTLFSGPDIATGSTYNTLALTTTGVVPGCYTNFEECVDDKGRVLSMTPLNTTLGDIVYTLSVPAAGPINGSYATGFYLLPVITPGCYQTVDNQLVCYNAGGQTTSMTASPVDLVYGNTTVNSTTLGGSIGGGLNLLPTGIVPGTYGGATLLTFTVNAYGQGTFIANGATALTTTTVFSGPSVTGTYNTLALVPTGFAAGTYVCNGQVSLGVTADSRIQSFGCVTSAQVVLNGTTTFYGYVDEIVLETNLTAQSITIRTAQPINRTSSPRFANLNISRYLFVGDDPNDPLLPTGIGMVRVRTPVAADDVVPTIEFYTWHAVPNDNAMGQIGAAGVDTFAFATFAQGGAYSTAAYTLVFPPNSASLYMVEYYPSTVGGAQRWEWWQDAAFDYATVRVWSEATRTDLFAAPHVHFCPDCQNGQVVASPGTDTFVVQGSSTVQATIELMRTVLYPTACMMQMRATTPGEVGILFGACVDAAGSINGYAVASVAYHQLTEAGAWKLQVSEAIGAEGQPLTNWVDLLRAYPTNQFGQAEVAVMSTFVAAGPAYFGVDDWYLTLYPAPGAAGKNVFWGTAAGGYTDGASWQFNMHDFGSPPCPTMMAASGGAGDNFIALDGSCDNANCYVGPNGALKGFFVKKTSNLVDFTYANGLAACGIVSSYTSALAIQPTRIDAGLALVANAGLHSQVSGTDLFASALGNNYNTLSGPAGPSASAALWEHYVTGDPTGQVYPVVQTGAYDRTNAYTARGAYYGTGAWRNSVVQAGPFDPRWGEVDQWDGVGHYVRVVAIGSPTYGVAAVPGSTLFTYREDAYKWGTTMAAGNLVVKPNPLTFFGPYRFAALAAVSYDIGTAEQGNISTITSFVQAQLGAYQDAAFVNLGLNSAFTGQTFLANTGQRGFRLGQLDAGTLRLNVSQSGTRGSAAVFAALVDFTATDTTHYTNVHVGPNTVAQLGLNQMTVTHATRPSYELYLAGGAYPPLQLSSDNSTTGRLLMGMYYDGSNLRSVGTTGFGLVQSGTSWLVVSAPPASAGSIVSPTTQATFTTSSFQVSPGGTAIAQFTASGITFKQGGVTVTTITNTDTWIYAGVSGFPVASFSVSAIQLLRQVVFTLPPYVNTYSNTPLSSTYPRLLEAQGGFINESSIGVAPGPLVGGRLVATDAVSQRYYESSVNLTDLLPIELTRTVFLTCDWGTGSISPPGFNFIFSRQGKFVTLTLNIGAVAPFTPLNACQFESLHYTTSYIPRRYWPNYDQRICVKARGQAGSLLLQADVWACVRARTSFDDLTIEIFNGTPDVPQFLGGTQYALPAESYVTYRSPYSITA